MIDLTKMTYEEKLEIRDSINEEFYNAKEAIEQGRTEEAKKLYEGKCMVYRRNSYSCPETEEDYWDVFYFIKKVSGSDHGVAVAISKDKDGCLKFEHEKFVFFSNLEHCEPEEFLEALKWVEIEVSDLSKKFGIELFV